MNYCQSVEKFDEVLKYELTIDDFNFGLMPPKKNTIPSIEDKKEKIDDISEDDIEDTNTTKPFCMMEISGSTGDITE